MRQSFVFCMDKHAGLLASLLLFLCKIIFFLQHNIRKSVACMPSWPIAAIALFRFRLINFKWNKKGIYMKCMCVGYVLME